MDALCDLGQATSLPGPLFLPSIKLKDSSKPGLCHGASDWGELASAKPSVCLEVVFRDEGLG